MDSNHTTALGESTDSHYLHAYDEPEDWESVRLASRLGSSLGGELQDVQVGLHSARLGVEAATAQEAWQRGTSTSDFEAAEGAIVGNNSDVNRSEPELEVHLDETFLGLFATTGIVGDHPL
jgi:hypothetical protein